MIEAFIKLYPWIMVSLAASASCCGFMACVRAWQSKKFADLAVDYSRQARAIRDEIKREDAQRAAEHLPEAPL